MDLRLSISSSPCGKSPEKAVRAIAGAGFHYAELGSEHGAILLARGPEAWKKFREYAASLGVQFEQGHLPLLDFITEKEESRRLRNVALHRNFCRMYHTLGITAAVLHCGGYDAWKKGESDEEVRARRTASLKDLLSDLPDEMSICLENLPTESFEDIEANIEAAGNPPNLGFCLDTGHLHFSLHPDAVGYIRRAGSRLKALHLHDNAGPIGIGDPKYNVWYSADKHMCPGFFPGSNDWEHIVGALRETGYSGLWNLEIEADLNSRIPSEAYRALILKQDRERAEMIFAFDSGCPAPGDPVNDLQKFTRINSAGVAVGCEKFKITVSSGKYSMKIDPGYAGRICSWQSFGREMLPESRVFGWCVFSIWQPANVSFLLKQGMLVDSVKAVGNGAEIRLSCTLDEDCEALKGCRLETRYLFTADSVEVHYRITAEAKTLPFAFRMHCMPQLLGGTGLPTGSAAFEDGTGMERRQTPCYFRVGEPDEILERPAEKYPVVDIAAAKVYLSAPDIQGGLRISFSGEQPQGLVFWDTNTDQCTFEPVFPLRTLQKGESAEFCCKTEIK